ncbi:trehalose-phosphatase [Paracoccus benzoatiresistens]|uniref:Trehalose 6-phosphate phosphatase n=1 Tax=Paracoccus benzoatiresistens TaxID=2997341 RepID=A0ABT4IZK3_9RHOB|nr:trehalose-phosphatase [Paracoccus sp. EF6]MCZ0960291.1 trehalose-phosphatase [Paracoccus sp. EF6]
MQPLAQNLPPLSANAALFLDFDGCLVEIAPRPDAVVVPPGLPQRLARLHERLGGAVALVSGRDIADLRSWLPDFPGAMAGSHGAELSLDGRLIETTHGVDLDVASLHRAAARAVADSPAILVERKPHGVALHYRADPSLRTVVEEVMQHLADAHPDMVLQPAKMAVELRPAGTGKDGALDRLMAIPPFAGRVPVYAGDDLTDEVAMAHAQARGGHGIKIGEGETVAHYRLSDPAALARWLDDTLAEVL